ncbi:Uncharacterised protein [Mycobacteroides abscessus]|nr:Uncharacterised protein [Mycobacteroides abscessus]
MPGSTWANARSPCGVVTARATVSSPSFVARTARYGVPPRQRGCAVTVTCGSTGGASAGKTSSASSSVYQVSLVRVTVFHPCWSSTWCVTDCQLPHVVCGKVTTPASAPFTVTVLDDGSVYPPRSEPFANRTPSVYGPASSAWTWRATELSRKSSPPTFCPPDAPAALPTEPRVMTPSSNSYRVASDGMTGGADGRGSRVAG